MARLAKKYVYEALEIAADHIRQAAGKDGITSRFDIRQKLERLEGTERALVDILYRFIDHRDYRKGARITEADIVAAVEYAKVHMVDKYDLQRNGLSQSEINNMSTTGKLAVQLARTLKRAGALASKPAPTEIQSQLIELSEGLIFDDFGSEGEAPVKAFFLESDVEEMSSDTLMKALGLDPNDINQRIERIFTPGMFWERFIDLNEFVERRDQAEELQEFMLTHTRELRVLILGEDVSGAAPQHRTLLVGMTRERDLAGIESYVVWT